MEMILTSYGDMEIDEARRFFEVGEVINRFGVWCVTAKGIECLYTEYTIEKDQLKSQDWPEHLSEKSWVNMRDFNQCYYAALQYHFPESEAA